MRPSVSSTINLFQLIKPLFPICLTLTEITNLSLPAYGVTFSESRSAIQVNNFSHPPNNVRTNIDVDALSLSNTGSVKASTNFDTVFSSETFAQSFSETQVTGSGSDFFGKATITSQAIGEFLIPAQEEFSFEYEGLLNTNFLANSQEIVNTGRISLFLKDNSQNKFINIFNESRLNNLGIQRSKSSSSFIGSFEKEFSEDTQLSLYATTQNQSCLNNTNSTCNSPPNPEAVPFKPSGKIGILLIVSFIIFSFIKKHIIKFFR